MPQSSNRSGNTLPSSNKRPATGPVASGAKDRADTKEPVSPIAPTRGRTANRLDRQIMSVSVNPSPLCKQLNAAGCLLGLSALFYVPLNTTAPWLASAILLIPLVITAITAHQDLGTHRKLFIHPDDSLHLAGEQDGARYSVVRSFHCHAFVLLSLQAKPTPVLPLQTGKNRRLTTTTSARTLIIAKDATNSGDYRTLRRWLNLSAVSAQSR